MVLTGATGAIGNAAALALSAPETTLVLLARPSTRLTAAVEACRTRGATAVEVPVDLSSMASVREAARGVAAAADRIDALVHTAAIFTGERRITADGFESMFATNHLAPFLLTNLLRPQLDLGARVVVVSAPSTSPVDPGRLATGDGFKPLSTFGSSKAANLLFAFELARRGADAGVRSNAFHPGLVRSGLMADAAAPLRMLLGVISRPAAAAGADLAQVAVSPEFAAATGQFFKGRKTARPPRASTDPDAQARLWQRSAELVQLEGGF